MSEHSTDSSNYLWISPQILLHRNVQNFVQDPFVHNSKPRKLLLNKIFIEFEGQILYMHKKLQLILLEETVYSLEI